MLGQALLDAREMEILELEDEERKLEMVRKDKCRVINVDRKADRQAFGITMNPSSSYLDIKVEGMTVEVDEFRKIVEEL